jgi:methionyl-tRNA synthetase
LTGTDEHGQKVEQSATAANKTPIEFADDVSLRFKKLVEVLGCSHDDFIRTTEDRHKTAVAALWKKLQDNGQIYLGAYEGWYSIRDEAFYAETEIVNGKAPTGADVEWVKEESYFFRLSDWTQKLLDFYEKYPDFIGPKGRRNEVVSFVGQEGGLKDLSVSRTTFSWGIPVPGDPKHVVYVWLDALTNYITALGYPENGAENFNKFWPASVHVVGKDILRFHAVFWPAFLMAAGLEPPKVR